MSNGRYSRYGEIKRKKRLKVSRGLKRQAEKNLGGLKNKSGSRSQKFESDKFFSETKKENNNGKTICKCGTEMEFYGVDGNGGSNLKSS